MSDKYEDLRKIIQEELLKEETLKETGNALSFNDLGVPSGLDIFSDLDLTIDLSPKNKERLRRFTNAVSLDNLKKLSSDAIKKIKDVVVSSNASPEEVADVVNAKIENTTQAASENALFLENFNKLLNTKVDFVGGSKLSVAGICLIATTLDNLKLENADREDKFQKVMKLINKYFTVKTADGASVIEVSARRIADRDLSDFNVSIKAEKLKSLEIYIHSGAGFAYEIAFGELIGVGADDVTKEISKTSTMNRVAGYYSYFIASLESEERISSETLINNLDSITKNTTPNALFEAFTGATSYVALKNELVRKLTSESSSVYITAMKASIASALSTDSDSVVYSFNPSSIGAFDIIAKSEENQITFDVKSTTNKKGIKEPSGVQIHKWKDKSSKYYGIINIIVNKIDWTNPILLEPQDKPFLGGMISINDLLHDLNNVIQGEKDKVKFFGTNKKGQTHAILKVDLNKLQNLTSTDPSETFISYKSNISSLEFNTIITNLLESELIIPKASLGTFSSDLVKVYKAINSEFLSINANNYDEEIQSIDQDSYNSAPFQQTRFFEENSNKAWFINLSFDIKNVSNRYKSFAKTMIDLGNLLHSKRNKLQNIATALDIEISKRPHETVSLNKFFHSFIIKIIDRAIQKIEPESSSVRDSEHDSSDEEMIHSYLNSRHTDKSAMEEFYNEIKNEKAQISEETKAIIDKILIYINKLYYYMYVANYNNKSYRGKLISSSHNISGSPLLEKAIRSLVRNILQEADKKTYRGSHPEESYGWSAKEEDFMFDKPGLTTWEEDRKWVKQYLKSMGLLAKK